MTSANPAQTAMNATAPAPPKPSTLGRPPAAMPSSNLSLAETARLTSLRRSTPDSEALASSDDEHELNRSIQSLAGRPSRSSDRSSWLNEIQSGPPRRASNTTSASGLSQPTTPYDQVNDSNGAFFQNPLGRVVSNPVNPGWNSFSPWAQSRLFADERQGFMPAREVRDTSPGLAREVQQVSKTHRSQSYSVGQTEADQAATMAQNSPWDRQRSSTAQQVPHRPSKPSMLSGVFEGSGAASIIPDRLERESHSMRGATSPDGRRDNLVESSSNPLLRHATQARVRYGQGAASADAISPSAFPSTFMPMSSAHAVEQVIDEEPELDPISAAGLTRRFSELTGLGGASDGSRRSQWHTSLGFGLLPDIPQSRRHSMAELPTRRNSLTAASPEDADERTHTARDEEGLLQGSDAYNTSAVHNEHQRDMQNRHYAVSYFSGLAPALRSQMESSQSPVSAVNPHATQYHHQGPSHGIFSRPGHDTPLCLVSFKCARAEVYYVADNTGLDVKEGDLVIVEADRGHDLGTVLNVKLSWSQARELKLKANDEHYRWLMMFSSHNRFSAPTTSGGTAGMMAGNAMDRPGASMQGGSFVPTVDTMHKDAELKPKMIKRLAQPHEIATLRDKEGNEAKAKRICQQKVNDMKLDMEILDAEFQTDWKKLTFFYYAHSYVNFNALVTDLFKVYKTRIWMSAVNPASLNTAPIPPPRAIGPGAVGSDSGTSPRVGTRPFLGAAGFNPNQFSGLSMFSGASANLYDYGNDSGGATPQGYDMLSFAPQAGYNVPMPGYGWGGMVQPGNLGFGGGLGLGYAMNPNAMQGGGGGGGQRGRSTQERGDFDGGHRAQQNPISPPGQQAQFRRQ